jgi:AcrR family transcriptional regulator
VLALSSIGDAGKNAGMSPRNQKKREPLSAERIAGTALALVDTEGLEGFSFRVLARHLGCEAMSIYHYYPSKSHLFDAMLDSCLGEIRFPETSLHWVEQLRAVAHQWRNMALRHPGFFPYLAVHRLNTRFALSVLNGILTLFEGSGREAEWRAKRFRTLGYYLMGALLDETSGYAKGPTTATPVAGDVIAREFPAVVAAGPFFTPAHHLETFERGLEVHLEQMMREALRQ